MQATFTRKKGTTKDGRDYDFISGRTIPDNAEFTISKKAFPELPEETKKLLEELPAGGLAAANLPEDFYIFTPEDEEGKKYPRRYLCKKKEKENGKTAVREVKEPIIAISSIIS